MTAPLLRSTTELATDIGGVRSRWVALNPTDRNKGAGWKTGKGGSVPPLRIDVSGGGPVGLTFALTLKSLLGTAVDITLFDARWASQETGINWKGEVEGNRRRDQVVTIQSGVVKDLPSGVAHALFGHGDYSTIWPFGRDSPREHGQPRNTRIRDVEDRLLALARNSDIRLRPERYSPARGRDLGCDVLAICEGAASSTREWFASAFGNPDPTPYLTDGSPVRDVVLSLGVTSHLDPSTAVVLTVAQSRFLLNTHLGRGVLNMRLTPEEACELKMVGLERRDAEGCLLSCGCALRRIEYAPDRYAYVCDRHRSALRPAMDPKSALWRRVCQGLKLFGVDMRDVEGVRAFTTSMTHRSRFSAELTPTRVGRRGTFGFLLGDAAGPIHVWPGRGLNFGLSSAVSLAHCLRERWDGGKLRHADFAKHEANMHMLQYRHKGRAWRAMVRFDEQGRTVPISTLIQDSIAAPLERERSIAELIRRTSRIRNRLKSRMDTLPSDADLCRQLGHLDQETLAVLVGSGVWETFGSGGEEVDVTRLFHSPGLAPNPTATPELPWMARALQRSGAQSVSA